MFSIRAREGIQLAAWVQQQKKSNYFLQIIINSFSQSSSSDFASGLITSKEINDFFFQRNISFPNNNSKKNLGQNLNKLNVTNALAY